MEAPNQQGPVPGYLKGEADTWFVVVNAKFRSQSRSQTCFLLSVLTSGLSQFATTSDGEKIANPRFLKSKLPELRRAQRSLSRKKKGGPQSG
jgi:putative transposase